MLATILVHVPLAIFPLLQLPSAPRECLLDVLTPLAIEERALAGYHTSIDVYLALHRRLARALPPMALFDDEEPFFADQLRSALVAARPLARPGEFFPPAVADVLRRRLDHAWPWTPAVSALPAVPSPLAYEFRGRDLRLVDVAANLVLDVLHDALPPQAASDVIYR